VTDTILKIDGMKCGGCATSVEEALRGVTGVRDVTVSLDAGEARVATKEMTSSESLVAAVVEAGFEAAIIDG
jgi:copper chaperone CopZ